MDLSEPIEKDGSCLLQMLIAEEDMENLELVLGLPREGYKTSKRPDVNQIDQKMGWSPLVAAINQGPRGHQEAISALLRAGADPGLEVDGLNAAQWAAKMNQAETLRTFRRVFGEEVLVKENENGNTLHAACYAGD